MTTGATPIPEAEPTEEALQAGDTVFADIFTHFEFLTLPDQCDLHRRVRRRHLCHSIKCFVIPNGDAVPLANYVRGPDPRIISRRVGHYAYQFSAVQVG